jgi:alpha/beta superfamily hydrolase
LPEVIFTGPEGRLEGRYQHGAGDSPPVALVLHPHPEHGGSMNNKVVYTLFHAFVEIGFSVLRFNFRGVGRSQGRYDKGQGELSDAASALDWLQSYNADAPACWIGGFSFGAWIALQLLMRRPELDGFIAMAPPADAYDFSFLAPCPVSGQVIHGSADEVVRVDSVTRLVHRLSTQRDVEIDYRILAGANHFFDGELAVIGQSVKDYVSARISAASRRG